MLPIWGKSCSPLVYENMVIVSAGGRTENRCVALRQGRPATLLWSGGDDASLV